MATDKESSEEVTVTKSSGNVFADLGVPEPEEALAKSHYVTAINRAMERRGLTQSKASSITGVSQPDLSKLLSGVTTGFTLDRIQRILDALGVVTHVRFEFPDEI